MSLAFAMARSARVVSTSSFASGALARGARCFSMPSRADTLPLALHTISAAAIPSDGLPVAHWARSTSAGLFVGESAAAQCKKASRAHALSPLLPAGAVLRSALGSCTSAARAQRDESSVSAAVVTLAEQTLSILAKGGASAWVLRDGMVLANVGEFSNGDNGVAPSAELVVALRPGDVVALLADSAAWGESEILHLARKLAGTSVDTPKVMPTELDEKLKAQISVWFCCGPMQSSDVWVPLDREDAPAPHPSWARTIFNEYGDHKGKL